MSLQKKALLVFSHPDDEVLFGWPRLLDDRFLCSVIICSRRPENAEASWRALKEIQDLCGIQNVKLLPHDVEFYKLEQRKTNLFASFCYDVVSQVRSELRSFDPDYLVTHNHFGEYGNADHILLHSLIRGTFNRSVKIICGLQHQDVGTWYVPPVIHRDRTMPLHIVSDLDLLGRKKYEAAKDSYVKRGLWTWDFEDFENVDTIEVN